MGDDCLDRLIEIAKGIQITLCGFLDGYGDTSSGVLICDDNASIRLVLRKLLKRRGWKEGSIREAENGEECLRLIQEDEPSLLFLDLMMPKMSGFEVLARIKSHRFKKVVITAMELDNGEKKILAELCDHWIQKPFDIDLKLEPFDAN